MGPQSHRQSDRMYATWTDPATKQAAFAAASDAYREVRAVRTATAVQTYKNAAPSASVRDGYSREDYDYFRPGEELPVGDKDVQSACMAAYRRFPVVRNVVDMMVDFVVKGIDVVHPSQRVQGFGREWFRRVKGKKLARKIARHLFRTGVAPVQRFSRKLPEATLQQLRTLGVAKAATAAIPARYKVLNPVTVDALGAPLSPFVDDDKLEYGVRVPSKLSDRVKEQRAQDQPVTNLLPKEVLDSLRQGTLVPIPKDQLAMVVMGKDDHEVWPTPMLYPLLDDLQMLVKLKGADRAALDGAISSIRVWKLGSLEHEIIPTRDAIAHLSDILMNNVGGGVMDLVWGPDLELVETSTEIHAFLGIEKYVPTLAAIYQGLGVPPSLAGMQDGGGMTNNFVSLRVLVERLESCRDELVEFFDAELGRLQAAFGFQAPFRLTFDVPALSDDSTEKKLLIDLLDRDIVSAELVVDRFGGDAEIEAARVRRDQRLRQAKKAPPKAGPYHLDSQQPAFLERTFAQQGETTPSQHGLDLPPPKPGERPANDRQAARRAKEVAAKTAASPGGRPTGARDALKRKTKRPAPKQSSAAVAETVLWALAARERLAEDLRPAFLAARGKKALRELPDEDARVFDRVVFGALCRLEPLAPVSAEAVDAALAAGPAVPPAVDALYGNAVARHRAQHAAPPAADQARRYQALAVALAAASV